METLTIRDAEGPNANGWFEITFDDGSKASTKNELLAKEAFKNRDADVDVVIKEQVRGRFTNRYLQEINGIKDTPPKRAAGGTYNGGRSDPKTQQTIMNQWAYGRAVDAFVALGDVTLEELTQAVNDGKLDELAAALLAKVK